MKYRIININFIECIRKILILHFILNLQRQFKRTYRATDSLPKSINKIDDENDIPYKKFKNESSELKTCPKKESILRDIKNVITEHNYTSVNKNKSIDCKVENIDPKNQLTNKNHDLKPNSDNSVNPLTTDKILFTEANFINNRI